jgi:putative transcriptional regulator
MSERRVFSYGKDHGANDPLHYKACGLDDVYLINGFERETTEYGDGLIIHDIDNLHRAIALHLVSEPLPLSAKDFRFLRKMLDLTQAELGGKLGVDTQTVARYEKGESASAPADRLLRFIVVIALLSGDEKAKLIETIGEILDADQPIGDHPFYFQSTEHGWVEGKR